MRTRTLIFAAGALSLLAAPAMAQTVSSPQVYGTIGYSQLDADDGDLGAVTGRIGAKLHRYVGVEGEASFGVNDDDVEIGIPGATVEHNYDVAGYVVGFLPINDNFELFGRVGYGTTELNVSAVGVDTDVSLDGVAYGVGANYFIDGKNGVRGDWTRRDFGDDGEADVWSLSYVRRF